MNTESFHSAAQALTFKILDEIDGDFCQEPVLVGLIYYWEAQNLKKGNMLMSVKLLLIDHQKSVEAVNYTC